MKSKKIFSGVGFVGMLFLAGCGQVFLLTVKVTLESMIVGGLNSIWYVGLVLMKHRKKWRIFVESTLSWYL